MSGHPNPKAPTPWPRPLLWAVAFCLIALAVIAIIAVSCLAGFNPQQLISLVHQIGSAARAVRG